MSEPLYTVEQIRQALDERADVPRVAVPEAKATAEVIVAVNTTPNSIAVCVGDEVVDLPAHEWLVRWR